MERQLGQVCMRSSKWSNDAIVSDLEWPLTQISRSRHYLTLNTSIQY